MFTYLCVRLLGEFLACLPRGALISLGKFLGVILYFCHREFRKKTLTNLAIAFGKKYSEKQLKKIALESFQNLALSSLEFVSFKGNYNKLSPHIRFEGAEAVISLLQKKQGVIFLSAHQANWEVPFIAVTTLFPGVGIGRPIKNRRLYKWVVSVREMHLGKIVMPKNGIREGNKALSEGKFLGIVGDQAFPESGYAYPFLGTRAWTATTPATLAYRNNCPLVIATTRREKKGFVITTSPPFWPNLATPLKEEIPRLMDEAMGILERSIEKVPGEWLWQHDKWKQQKIDHVKRKYRFAFILVVLPPDPTPFTPLITLIQEIYPRGFISYLVPKGCKITFPQGEIHTYASPKDLYLRDYRYQLVFDFYNIPGLRRHFRKLGAFQTLNCAPLTPETLTQTLCKPDASRSFFY